MALNIIKNYLTNNRCYQSGTTCNKIGIQIHTIGTGQGTAQSVADYWNQPSVSACVHYVCDADTPGKVLHLLPETIRAWADAGWGNNNLITIEICESDYIRYTNGASYVVTNEELFKADIMRGYNTAIMLCAKICKDRGWNPTAKLPNGMYLISSHNEGRLAGLSSAHVDPDHVWSRFGLTMDGLRKAVKNYMDTGSFVSDTLYRIRKDWDKPFTQTGAYKSLNEAKKACKPGYSVYDASGKEVYYSPVFSKKKKYRMDLSMALRKEPKANAEYVKFDDIPAAKQKYFKKGKNGEALIKKGTVDKCYGEIKVGTRGIYMKVLRGWILAQLNGKDRVTEVK